MNTLEFGIHWEWWVWRRLVKRGYKARKIKQTEQWPVGQSWGKGYHCDIVIDDLRIEVKATMPEKRSRVGTYPIHIQGNRQSDFVVSILVTEYGFEVFVFPGDFVGFSRTFTWPYTDHARVDIEPYRNAWHLIDEKISTKKVLTKI